MPNQQGESVRNRPVLTLGDLRPGDRATVRACRGDGAVFQRLCEMGFVEGTPVRLVRYAPFGDPLEVDLQGCHLSLRRAEAGMVEVAGLVRAR